MVFHDHFSGHAESYRRYRPTYPAELFVWIAGQAASAERAWDCATGNGQAAVGLAEHFGRVVATDASIRQLRQAEADPRVSYVLAAAEAAPLRVGSVDLVTVAQAMHWLDARAFYAEVRRVARPGALLVVWTYQLFSVSPEIDAILVPFHHETLAPYWAPERRHVVSGYATLPFPFDEIEAPGFTMRPRWTRDDVLNQISTWSAVRRHDAETGEDAVQALSPTLAEVWPDRDERKELDWRISVRAGRII